MFNKQKQYFKKKLDGVQKMIWDLEFKREKTLEIREGLRGEYDAMKARLDAVLGIIKGLPEDKTAWTDEQKQLEDQKVLFERDATRLENQMKELDLDVNGSPKCNEYPDGADGINDQLEALQQLKGLVIKKIKSI